MTMWDEPTPQGTWICPDCSNTRAINSGTCPYCGSVTRHQALKPKAKDEAIAGVKLVVGGVTIAAIIYFVLISLM